MMSGRNQKADRLFHASPLELENNKGVVRIVSTLQIPGALNIARYTHLPLDFVRATRRLPVKLTNEVDWLLAVAIAL